MSQSSSGGVLLLYTGGSTTCWGDDRYDPNSPLVSAPWSVFEREVHCLKVMREKFPIDCYAFSQPLDSTDIQPGHWVEMVEVIERHYDRYEGFVILHGTDTMAFTAAALSFMLENLGKPVVLTGSQLPILGNPRNDGEQNLITALLIANPSYSGLPVIPEVCIYFGGKLLRGNRARKLSSKNFDAFHSPNYPLLGTAGDRIRIEESLLCCSEGLDFRTKRSLCTDVISLQIFPGIQNSDLMERLLHLPRLRGIVLNTYGAGNAPTDVSFLQAIERAREKGVILLNVSQCIEGMVELGVYETSVSLLERGVLSGFDITPEAALCKLMVLLGEEDLSTEEVAGLVQRNLAGEQSYSLYSVVYDLGLVSLGGEENRYRFPGRELGGHFRSSEVERVVLRLRGGVVEAAESPLEVRIFFNLSREDPLDEARSSFLGRFYRQVSSVPRTLSFDLTSALRGRVFSGVRLSFTVAISSGGGRLSWRQAELSVYVRE
ncbi:MAG: asparaginase [Planctomycetota bacterium]|nr:MAG: asparaginase [Planctomycetota bacterium]